MDSNVNSRLRWEWRVDVGSSFLTAILLWWGILRAWEAVHIWEQDIHDKSLGFPLCFTVNLELLWKKKKSVQTNKQTKSLYLLLNSRKCFIAFPMLLKLEVLSPAPFYLCTFISSCSFLSPAFCFPSTFISFRLEWFVPSPSSGLGPASPPCLLSVYPSCRPELILISWRLRGDPCLSSRFCHIFPKVFWLLLLGLSYKNQASSPEPLSLLYLDIPNNEYSCLLFNIALLH